MSAHIPSSTMAHLERGSTPDWLAVGLNLPMMSMLNMVLALNKVVSAEDITAQSKAARMMPPRSGENNSLMTVGKACSGVMPGNREAAPMPMMVMAKAKGMIRTAVHNVALLATRSSRAQKMREYMSGPTM